MKSILAFIFRSLVSLTISVVIWPVAFFGFDVAFWMSTLLAILGGGATYYILKAREHQKHLKHNQLTRKEFQYIDRNLKEAQLKIKRLNKAMVGVRSFRAAKLIGNLQRTVRQIYQIVKNEPKRFYQAERFFFYHLDSIVELSERYVFLTRQKVKDLEVRLALSETEQTLDKLSKSLDDDLLTVLSNDIETLNLELDVAKQTHDRYNSLLFEEQQSPDYKSTESKQNDQTDRTQNLLPNNHLPIQIKLTNKVDHSKNVLPDERRS